MKCERKWKTPSRVFHYLLLSETLMRPERWKRQCWSRTSVTAGCHYFKTFFLIQLRCGSVIAHLQMDSGARGSVRESLIVSLGEEQRVEFQRNLDDGVSWVPSRAQQDSRRCRGHAIAYSLSVMLLSNQAILQRHYVVYETFIANMMNNQCLLNAGFGCCFF